MINKYQKKDKMKTKDKFFYKNLKDEPELNNFDVDEVYFDEIIDEEDQSTTQKIRNEKNDYSFDTPYIAPRTIKYEILKTNKGYRLIHYTNSNKVPQQIQKYLDSFPIFIQITKERIEAMFVSDRNQQDFFVVDKNLNSYHNLMLPNGEVIPLTNLLKEGGGPIPKEIKLYREYRKIMYESRNHFNEFERYFDLHKSDLEQHKSHEFIKLFIMFKILKKNNKSNEYIKEFYNSIKNSNLFLQELEEIFKYILEAAK